MIPVDKIKILNARARNRARFKEIAESIKTVGLKKPIVVRKHRIGDGYDLVCGQGRLEVFVSAGETHVPAVVVDVSTHDLYVMSLAENLARRMHTTLEDVRQLLALRERGYTQAEIARKVGMTDGRVSSLLNLITSGEERLLLAVERGDIPMHVAMQIAVPIMKARSAPSRTHTSEASYEGTLCSRRAVSLTCAGVMARDSCGTDDTKARSTHRHARTSYARTAEKHSDKRSW